MGRPPSSKARATSDVRGGALRIDFGFGFIRDYCGRTRRRTGIFAERRTFSTTVSFNREAS